jgi:hypothetical protein
LWVLLNWLAFQNVIPEGRYLTTVPEEEVHVKMGEYAKLKEEKPPGEGHEE